MITIKNIHRALLYLLFAGIMVSCNKDLPVATPIDYSSTNAVEETIGEVLQSDTSYSFFLAAAKRIGADNLLMDQEKVFTLFVPDNNAFRLSGIPSEAVIGAMPIQQIGAIVQYHIIPGRQYLSEDFPEDFPNVQLPSFLTIGTLPGTTIPLQMSLFLSRRGQALWVNNVPVTSPDHLCNNGVIHEVAFLVKPPSTVLKEAIYSNPDLSYFKAAIARADSGKTGLERFDYLLGYPVTNMTVLTPNNAAFQTIIFGAVYGYLVSIGVPPATAQAQAASLASTPDIFSNPASYSILPAEKVRGIIAYHFLATNPTGVYQPNIRAFSNNFSATPDFYTTLVNSAISIHPGVMGQATFTGPMVSALQFTGLGTFPPGGAPYSGPAAQVVSKDNIAVNGVFHIIDKVLLPQ